MPYIFENPQVRTGDASDVLQETVSWQDSITLTLPDGNIAVIQSYVTWGYPEINGRASRGDSGLAIEILDPDLNDVSGQLDLVRYETQGLYDAQDIAFFDAVVLSDGRIAVAWNHETATRSASPIQYQIFNADGTPATALQEIPLSDFDVLYDADISITELNNGGFAISYTHDLGTGEGSQVFVQRFDSTGAEDGSVIAIDSAPDETEWNPDLITRPDGSFVVAWQSYNTLSTEYDISFQIFDEDGAAVTQSTELTLGELPFYSGISYNPQDDPYGPALGARPDGGFFIGGFLLPEDANTIFDADLFIQHFDSDGTRSEHVAILPDNRHDFSSRSPLEFTVVSDDLALVSAHGSLLRVFGEGRLDSRSNPWNLIARDADGNPVDNYDFDSSSVAATSNNEFYVSAIGRDADPNGNSSTTLLVDVGEITVGNFGTDGDDIFYNAFSSNFFDGGAGRDMVDYSDESNFRVYVDLQGDPSWIPFAFRSGAGEGDYFVNIEDAIGGQRGDQLRGNAEANMFDGGGSSDRLYGRSGDDTLMGGTGADAIYGNAGADIMTGGPDARTDRYIYFQATDTGVGAGNRDVITDFVAGEDRIELSRIDADISQGFKQGFDFIGDVEFSGTAGELRYEQIGGNTIVQADRDGDGLADMEIELTGIMDLTTDDFLI